MICMNVHISVKTGALEIHIAVPHSEALMFIG